MATSDIDRSPELQRESIDFITPIGFEAYREICDRDNAAFRKLGLLDPELYDAAAADPASVYLESGHGLIPFLVPVKYAAGYDAERSEQLMGDDRALFLAKPAASLTSDEVECMRLWAADRPVLVEAAEDPTDAMQQAFADEGFTVGEFIDTEMRVNTETDRLASVVAFRLRSQPTIEGDPNLPVADSSDIEAVYKLLAVEDPERWGTHDQPTRTEMYSAERLIEDPELMAKLWEVVKDRFSEMGAAHPVSAEEDEDFFRAMLFDSGTATCIKFVDGEPEAFGTIFVGLDGCHWMSDQFRKDVTNMVHGDQELAVYYPEIVARKTGNALGSSRDIMAMQAAIFARAGRPVSFIFECFNRSAVYVPTLSERNVNRSGYARIAEPVTKLSSMRYWYIKNLPAA